MKRNIIAFAIAITLFSCNQAPSAKMDKEISSTETSSGNEDELKSNSENDIVTGKTVDAPVVAPKIIKTADIKFRVQNAWKTKTQINNELRVCGGTLVESSIQSNIVQKEYSKYSTDSLLEISAYNTVGAVTVKVPSENLDKFVDAVIGYADFVDYQSIKFDDQSINYLINKMKTQNRVAASNAMEKIVTKKKEEQVEKVLSMRDNVADQKAANLSVDNQVKFSTITLNFYQENTIKKLIIANNNLTDYRPAFFKRLGINLLNGWGAFTEIILVLANIWILLLLIVGAGFGINYYKKKHNSSDSQEIK